MRNIHNHNNTSQTRAFTHTHTHRDNRNTEFWTGIRFDEANDVCRIQECGKDPRNGRIVIIWEQRIRVYIYI